MAETKSIRKRNTIADNVAADMRRMIDDGHYPVGSRLPGRREFAQKYGVAPLTIQQAMSALASDGLIRAETGRGTFVARRTIVQESPLGKIGLISEIWPSEVGRPSHSRRHTLLVATERLLSAQGGTTIFANRQTCDEVVPISDAVDVLLAQQVNAIVVVGAGRNESFDQAVEYSLKKGIPLLVLSEEALDTAAPCVMSDDVKGGEQAAMHLIDQGCRSLLYFSGVTTPWASNRLRGARNAVRKAGLPPDSIWVCMGRSKLDSPSIEHSVWLELCASETARAFDQSAGFDGVVCSNDAGAIAFISAARDRGLDAPRDYLIVGFDDSDEARSLGITSMQMPITEIANQAAGLLRQIVCGSKNAESISLPFHLVARTSTWRRDLEVVAASVAIKEYVQ